MCHPLLAAVLLFARILEARLDARNDVDLLRVCLAAMTSS
jgi:hypothetical protein